MSDGPVTGEVRISPVVGDRLCIRCGFNLTGQMVVREPHYQMLIVRCPECSTVAALQEYPTLGRWANRWASLLAGLWLLVMVALLIATAGTLFGLTMLASDGFGDRYAEHISRRHNEWVRSLPDAQTTLGANYQWLGGQADSPDSWVDASWWAKQDAAALLAEIGGPMGGLNWASLWQWPWLGLAGLVAGAVWSLVMLARPRWWVMTAMLLPLAVAGAIAWTAWSSMTSSYGWMGNAQSVSDLAHRRLGWPVVPAMLLGALPMLCLGAWMGRPLARAMVRAFLPPRMIGSLAFLWIAEGKDVPRPGRTATSAAARGSGYQSRPGGTTNSPSGDGGAGSSS